ncbi:MAG: penicillin-binding protein 2, partial [Acidobacteria bacterium]|nr:penicillin-binding protein 2 [Acidobacteriota bacterium]
MKHRLYWLAGFAVLWCLGIAARLYSLQVVQHETYSTKAERQQQRVIEIDPPRGTIYDARGRVLAVSVEVDSAFAVPRAIEDPVAVAKVLAPILNVSSRKLAEELEGDGEFTWLARKLDPPVATAIREKDLPGIHFLKEYKRYYPQGRLAASVLGFVGVDNQGLDGLEYQYDAVIAGKQGERTVLRDARRGSLSSPSLPSAAAEPGQDLYLTLDASLQHLAEMELERAVKENRARAGSIVLLDPFRGAVLAMASYPGFDPNRFTEFPKEHRKNLAVASAFEPGSTFKVVTFASALDANLIDPNDVVDCGMGGITLLSTRIRDYKPFGRLSFREVLAKSSNVGTIKAVQRIPREEYYEDLRAFGLGTATGVDLPGESSGILRPLESWSALAPAYISFGQGIATTALQLTNAFAVVANGGTLYRPYLVEAVGSGPDIRRLHPEPEALGHPITPSTALQLERMLEGLITPEGTGKAAGIEGYQVAGKTGTAQ